MRTKVIGIFLLAVLVATAASVFAQADKYPTIYYKRADDHVGEIVWVEGTVQKTLKESEGTYLCFNNDEKYIRVLIPKDYLGNFEGSFKHAYLGKKIKAIGKVDKFGKGLIVGISEPKRIRIVDSSTD